MLSAFLSEFHEILPWLIVLVWMDWRAQHQERWFRYCLSEHDSVVRVLSLFLSTVSSCHFWFFWIHYGIVCFITAQFRIWLGYQIALYKLNFFQSEWEPTAVIIPFKGHSAHIISMGSCSMVGKCFNSKSNPISAFALLVILTDSVLVISLSGERKMFGSFVVRMWTKYHSEQQLLQSCEHENDNFKCLIFFSGVRVWLVVQLLGDIDYSMSFLRPLPTVFFLMSKLFLFSSWGAEQVIHSFALKILVILENLKIYGLFHLELWSIFYLGIVPSNRTTIQWLHNGYKLPLIVFTPALKTLGEFVRIEIWCSIWQRKTSNCLSRSSPQKTS